MNADGTGRMSLSVDLSEMMAFGGELSKDSSFVKQDTVIKFKDILKEKKDSIAQLPETEQARLRKMENYSLRIVSDSETNFMKIDIFTSFKNVNEANDLMKGFEESGSYMPGGNDLSVTDDSSSEPEIIGVNYSFEKGIFKRDAFIIDEVRHKAQLDSMKPIESFMGGMMYKIKYTFAKRIKSSSAEDATYSLNGRTIELEHSFLDYFKNPDVLDITVELED